MVNGDSCQSSRQPFGEQRRNHAFRKRRKTAIDLPLADIFFFLPFVLIVIELQESRRHWITFEEELQEIDVHRADGFASKYTLEKTGSIPYGLETMSAPPKM
jgi:hypothetical protein